MSILVSSLVAFAALIGHGRSTDYVFVFLKTGAARDITPEKMGELQAGHFANIGRLAEEGWLMIAGPYGEPRVDPALRGAFLFDVDEVVKARRLTESDPAVLAGALALEAHPFRSRSAVRWLRVVERRAKAEGTAGLRAYVLATTRHAWAGERALSELMERDEIVFAGQFGGDLEGLSLFALAVDDTDQGRRMLPDDIDWTLYPWYSTTSLLELPKIADRLQVDETVGSLEGHDELAGLQPVFAKHVDVFGIPVVATGGVSHERLLHAAHLLAQCLDNDEDGQPDNAFVVDALWERGTALALAADDEEREALRPTLEKLGEGGFELKLARQRGESDLETIARALAGAYSDAYPEVFGAGEGSALASAMDSARTAEDPWFRVPHASCDRACRAAEYLSMALTSWLDGYDDERRADVSEVWRLGTRELLIEGDPAVRALLIDPRFRIPQRHPDGEYGD